jgi:phage/plasmid primase, P4 family, C-terminal domain
LVVTNGILNLHTGDLEEHTPTEYHRTYIDVRWNPDAGEPGAIDEFLHEIVADDDVVTLYRLIAHTLYKEYVSEKAAILIGSGKNGKSIFGKLVETFIGKPNVSRRELQDFDDDDFAANNLKGKLANIATEIGEQELKDTTSFKKLTGRDTMDAQVKYESPVTFENYATMMFGTNNMPVFGQDNYAIWRRWVFLDFPYTFDATDPGAKDPEPKSAILDRITTDAQFEALLLRCQQEIQRWHETDESFFEDAMEPSAVRDKMKKAAEPVYNFASVCLSAGDREEDFVKKSLVRAAYRAYADIEDLPTVSENVLGERLIALRDYSIETDRKRLDGVQGRTQVYTGIKLSQRGRQILNLDTPDADDDQSQVNTTPSDTDTDTNDGPNDEPEQKTDIVLRELEEMVEYKDGDPVPRNELEWRAAKSVGGKVTAENAVDKLLRTGRIVENGDDVFPADF